MRDFTVIAFMNFLSLLGRRLVELELYILHAKIYCFVKWYHFMTHYAPHHLYLHVFPYFLLFHFCSFYS